MGLSLLNKGIPRAIGIGAGLLTVVRIGKNSAMEGLSEAKYEEGKELTDVFLKQNSGDADVLEEGASKWYLKFRLDEKVSPVILKIKNMAKSIAYQTTKNVIPIGLIAGAITGIPVLAPVCAGGLLLLGARFLIEDVMKIGKE